MVACGVTLVDAPIRQTSIRPSSPIQGSTACPNPGAGLEKVTQKLLNQSSPWGGNRTSRGTPICGRNNERNNSLKLRIATWNIRTMLDGRDNNDVPRRRTALIAMELSRYNVDIAALSETRLSDEGSLCETGAGYTFFWKGYPSGSPRIHGVGMALKNSLVEKLTESPTYISERLMTLRLPLARGEYATVISAYAPTLKSDEETKDQFYNSLIDTLSRINRTDKVILLGDFNARVGKDSEMWPGVLGGHGVGNMNSNGLRLLTLCTEHNLSLTNTFFRMRDKYKTSWMHPRSRHWHLIDYIAISRNDLSTVIKTRAMRGAECSTDHRLIVSDMRLSIRPKTRLRSRTVKKLNTRLLKDPEKRSEFQQVLEEKLDSRQPIPEEVDVTGRWQQLSSDLGGCAESTLGICRRKNRDWFDDNSSAIAELVQAKNRAHNAAVANPSSVTLRNRFKELRSETQRELRRIENGWWVSLAEEIQGYADSNDAQNFFNAVKQAYGPMNKSVAPVRSSDGATLFKKNEEIVGRWAEHFSSLLNVRQNISLSILEEIPQRITSAELDGMPTLDEVRKCVGNLKNGKSPGTDGLPAELFKYGGDALNLRLHELLCHVWEYEEVPTEWKESLIVAIYKNKGDRSVCGNSRGISLLSVAGKIMAKILLGRLIPSISEDILPETQAGFRPNRSTSDMIFVSRQLLEKCREQHRPLFVGFLDLSKAFDTVDREILWAVLSRAGCPDKFIRLVRLLHDGMRAKVRVGSLESEPFDVSGGVKQGCVLAPVLFNIFIQCVTFLLHQRLDAGAGAHISFRTDRNLFDLKKLKARTKRKNTRVLELQYADDCTLVAHTPTDLQSALTAASAIYETFGLKVNTDKTEVLCWSPGGDSENSPTEFHIENSALKIVKDFKYLGTYLSSDCRMDREVENRISHASSAYYRLRRRVFHNHNLSLTTKIKVYDAVCLSALLYGSEAWTLYARQLKLLEAWHIKSLRSMLRISWWDRVTHSDILKRSHSISIESNLSRRQLRWVGHVIRMPDERLPKQVLYGELSEGLRSAGGQKKRFKDHLKRTLKKCEIDSGSLETNALERPNWRSICHRGVEKLERDRHSEMERRRNRRHERNLNPPPQNEAYTCKVCKRICRSRIGLRSHVAAHQRRASGRQDVIIGNDGPP